MINQILHIGIDDTDSLDNGCTTYIGALFLDFLKRQNCKFLDYPYLIRLNPNIPFKTRGNAAVCIKVKYEKNMDLKLIEKFFKEILIKFFKKQNNKPQPALCLFIGDIPNEIEKFYKKSLIKVINLSEALKLANKYNIRLNYTELGLNGIIGAIAAIGANLNKKFTYELLTYRNLSEKTTIRPINQKKVIQLEKLFGNYIFYNYDAEKKRILITPHGKDPVLFGIRGLDPLKLIEAMKFLDIEKYIEAWVIYKTNQGTDVHLNYAKKNLTYDEYSVIFDEFIIKEDPIIIPGGHVILKVKSKEKDVEIAVYKESGIMNTKARFLKKNDIIMVGGGLKKINGKTVINAEKIIIRDLAEEIEIKKPVCSCGLQLKSLGDGKGFKCKNCKKKIPIQYYLVIKKERKLKKNEILLPPIRSRRHLTKPEKINFRYLRKELIEPFFYFKKSFL